jgi:hypothetical protein
MVSVLLVVMLDWLLVIGYYSEFTLRPHDGETTPSEAKISIEIAVSE